MKVKLGDVCKKGSSNLKQSDVIDKVGEYPVYGATGYLGSVNFYHQKNPYVAVVKDGAGIGRTTLYPAKSSVIGTMQYLLPKENILPEYLCYVVRYMHLEKYFTGATIPHIYFKDYKNEKFNLDTIDRQIEIVDILTKTENVIELHRQELEKLNNLIKARFVELFINRGYPRKTIADISIGKGEYGAQSASIEYDINRPRYVRITDINDDGTLNDNVASSVNPADDKQFKLEYGDFLFARMGATVGKTYMFIEGNQIFAGYLIRYKLNLKLVNPRYLFWYTKMDEYSEWIKLNQSGAAQPGINAKKYESLQIPLPPIGLQNEFAEFVKLIDKSKVAVQKALDEAQLLFDSLMQKYFG